MKSSAWFILCLYNFDLILHHGGVYFYLFFFSDSVLLLLFVITRLKKEFYNKTTTTNWKQNTNRLLLNKFPKKEKRNSTAIIYATELVLPILHQHFVICLREIKVRYLKKYKKRKKKIQWRWTWKCQRVSIRRRCMKRAKDDAYPRDCCCWLLFLFIFFFSSLFVKTIKNNKTRVWSLSCSGSQLPSYFSFLRHWRIKSSSSSSSPLCACHLYI